MPKHHIDLLLKVATYFAALFIIVGITGATLVHWVPSVLPVFSVVLAFIASVVIVGAFTWAIIKSGEFPARQLSSDS